MTPNPHQHLPYQCRPRGNTADPRIMGFGRATALMGVPDYAMRRVAAMHRPDVLDVLSESGASRDDIAAALGFNGWPRFRFWLYDRCLLDGFTAAYREAADLFIDAANLMEWVSLAGEAAAQGIHVPLHFSCRSVVACYTRYTPKQLRRMAGRNNPDKYTPAGKLKAPRQPFFTAKFTGPWSPSLGA